MLNKRAIIKDNESNFKECSRILELLKLNKSEVFPKKSITITIQHKTIVSLAVDKKLISEKAEFSIFRICVN